MGSNEIMPRGTQHKEISKKNSDLGKSVGGSVALDSKRVLGLFCLSVINSKIFVLILTTTEPVIYHLIISHKYRIHWVPLQCGFHAIIKLFNVKNVVLIYYKALILYFHFFCATCPFPRTQFVYFRGLILHYVQRD